MKMEQIQREALELTEQERAALVLSLLDTLSFPSPEVSDEEIAQRDTELASGGVEAMDHEEFVRRVQADRSR